MPPPNVTAGTGTAQQAYEAEVARRASQAAAQQRREQVHALLQADGLSLRECTGCTRIQQHLANVVSFADEQLLAAARTHIKQERERHRRQRAEAERSGRQATMTQLLTDAGLHSFYACELVAVHAYGRCRRRTLYGYCFGCLARATVVAHCAHLAVAVHCPALQSPCLLWWLTSLAVSLLLLCRCASW